VIFDEVDDVRSWSGGSSRLEINDSLWDIEKKKSWLIVQSGSLRGIDVAILSASLLLSFSQMPFWCQPQPGMYWCWATHLRFCVMDSSQWDETSTDQTGTSQGYALLKIPTSFIPQSTTNRMPPKPTATQTRLKNVTTCLTITADTVKMLADNLDVPLLQTISVTTQSLLKSIQVTPSQWTAVNPESELIILDCQTK
jgi:hypothetical protein